MASPTSVFRDGEIRMVLIGKTGSGKSSLANTILGKDVCETSGGMSSKTQVTRLLHTTWRGLNVSVADTPGVCDTDRRVEEVHREICKSIICMAPGPHAILMCLRCDSRFTQEELEAYKELKKLFGHGIVRFMILVFCGLDKFKGKAPDYQIEGEKNKRLGQVLGDIGQSGDHIFSIDNLADWSERNRQSDQLLRLITQMVQHNGSTHYQTEIGARFYQRLIKMAQARGKSIAGVKQEVLDNPQLLAEIQEELPREQVKSETWCTIL